MSKLNPSKNFSIDLVIPVFQLENSMVERALRIALKQLPETSLVIVVDSLREQCRPWDELDSRVRHIQETQRLNASQARNKGAALGESEWIAFLDGDCFWLESWLARAMQLVKENPELRAATGPVFYEDPKLSWAYALHVLEFHEFSSSLESFRPRFLASGNLLIRRDFFEALGGFIEDLEACQDISFLRGKNARDYPDTYLRYHPEIAVVHSARLDGWSQVNQKIRFMGYRRGLYDRRLADCFRISEKTGFSFFRPFLGLIFPALIVLRCLKIRSLFLSKLFLLMPMIFILSLYWAKEFRKGLRESPTEGL